MNVNLKRKPDWLLKLNPLGKWWDVEEWKGNNWREGAGAGAWRRSHLRVGGVRRMAGRRVPRQENPTDWCDKTSAAEDAHWEDVSGAGALVDSLTCYYRLAARISDFCAIQARTMWKQWKTYFACAMSCWQEISMEVKAHHMLTTTFIICRQRNRVDRCYDMAVLWAIASHWYIASKCKDNGFC